MDKQGVEMSKGLFGRVNDELEAREKNQGLSMGDLFAIPDDGLRSLLIFVVREKIVDMQQLVKHLKKSESDVKTMLASAIEKGYVREIEMKGQVHYRVRHAITRTQDLSADIWAALTDKIQKEVEE
jgi:hypothetical protein